MNIQWYPGHMTKARRQMEKNAAMVDVIIELLDARIPASSRNPDLSSLLKSKPRVVVLNKADLADQSITTLWLDHYKKIRLPAVAVNTKKRQGLKQMLRLVVDQTRPIIKKYTDKGRRARLARCMVVGIPNVGKSMLINALAGKKHLRIANKPGVTRGEQWITLSKDLELLDTPGVLWPKFDDADVAFKLAATGAIKEQIYDPEQIAHQLVGWLAANIPQSLESRYQITLEQSWQAHSIMGDIGAKRGFYQAGGKIDLHQTSILIIKEFREGALGSHTMDLPPGYQNAKI